MDTSTTPKPSAGAKESKGEQMNKQEIDEMMKDLPSQQGWREESTTEKWIGGLAFTLFLIMICFI
jgi:hypothetical protein